MLRSGESMTLRSKETQHVWGTYCAVSAPRTGISFIPHNPFLKVGNNMPALQMGGGERSQGSIKYGNCVTSQRNKQRRYKKEEINLRILDFVSTYPRQSNQNQFQSLAS